MLIVVLILAATAIVLTCNNKPAGQVESIGEVIITDEKYPVEVFIFSHGEHVYLQFGRTQPWGTHHPDCPNTKHDYEKTQHPVDSPLSNNYYYLRAYHD